MVEHKQCKDLGESQKWLISLYIVIIFMVVGAPFMYKLTNYIFKGSSSNGCPNFWGLILHGIVFGLLVRAAMFLPV
jgi:hypothetical protein